MLKVMSPAEDFRKFIENLKPLSTKLEILYLSHHCLDYLHRDVIRMIAEVLEGKRLSYVSVGKILANTGEM